MSDKTLVTFLLDETGSMGSIKDDTIGGFNEYLSTLKKSATPIAFTLIKFDSRRLEKVHVAVPVAEAKELTNDSYQPGASTPLIDAAYKTIKAVEKSLNGENPKVVICIQTDGQENASTEFTWDELNALIKEKSALGWQFNFLGTGIDAYATGSKMGVAMASSMSSTRSGPHVRASMRAVAEKTSLFAAGARADSAFDDADRVAAGDEHFEKYRGQGPANPPVPVQKTKAVDDFEL